MIRFRLFLAFTCMIVVSIVTSPTGLSAKQLQIRFDHGLIREIAQVVDQKEEKEEESTTSDEDDTPIADTSDPQRNAPDISEKHIRIHLWDGLIVGGDVSVDAIDVDTEFGTLRIPVDKILKFYPGLDSLTDLDAQLKELVENLGDKNFEIREQSHRSLLAMGKQIREEIKNFDDGGSAERKKHLQEIKKQIEELEEEFENTDKQPVLIRGDTIVTEHFSIVGKIKQDQFQMSSKFGELKIKLADIKLADRTFNQARQEFRKTMKVGAQAFFQTTPASTKIRVNRGDRISVSATGMVNWTNWSQSCGPDGMTNQGQWSGINCGTLCARIGKSGKVFKVGSKEEFTAKESGVLHLGIAMRDTYATNGSYRWTGNYDAKIIVKPNH